MESQGYLEQAGVSDAEWEQTPISVKRLFVVLTERLETQFQQTEKQKTEIEWLKEKLSRDSGNSSLPPSTDEKKASLPKTGKKRETTRGTSRARTHFRKLRAVEECESVEDYYPEQCWSCGAALEQVEGEPTRHQVVEIPPIQLQVKEYRLHQCVCTHCQCLTRASLPSEVSAKGYGPRVVAIVGVLSGMYRQSQRMVQAGMSDLFGLKLSLGSINNLRHESSQAVAIPVAQAQGYVQQSAVVGADETGFRQGNSDGHNPEGRKAWLWVAVTPWVTFFQITLSRSQASAQTLLGEAFKGKLITDRHGAYTWVDQMFRQLCWAHLKRDFIQIAERSGVSGPLGTQLLLYEKRLFELWYQVRDGTMTRAELIESVKPLRLSIQALLSEGAADPIGSQERSPLAQTVRTCRRLLNLEPAMCLFVSVEGVEPTNNDAERALRPAVIWRRLSLGAQTQAGSIFVSRMLTVVSSLRSQNRNVLDFMTLAIQANRESTSPPSLLPQHSSDTPQPTIAA